MKQTLSPRRAPPRAFARLSLLCAASTLGWSSFAPAAIADDAATPAVGAAESEMLAPITVTARKTDEQAKDVPVSLSVVDGAAIEQRRLDTLQDVLHQTPGVDMFSYGDSNITVRMRGVGSLSRISSDDSSVMMYIDGQPQPMSSAALATLDVERVEILKGPQGTLYGRNSESGAVNVVTRRPTDTLEGYARAEVGTHGKRLGEAAAGGPLAETLSGRLAVRYGEHDYPVDNARTGDPLTDPDDLAVRGTLLWQPATSDTDVTLTMAHEQANDRVGASVLMPFGDSPAMDAPPGSFDDDLHNTTVGVTVEHALNWAVLTSQTGVGFIETNVEGPFYDGLIYQRLLGFKPASFRQYIGEERTVNQEVRLSSQAGTPVFWVTGANLYNSRRAVDTRNTFDTLNPVNPFNADIDRDFETTSGAIFGEVTYPLTDALKLTGGLRQTWERKTYDAEWRAAASNPSPRRRATDSSSLTDAYTTGRTALSYEVTPHSTLYGTYARGYKSGGYTDQGSNIASGLSDRPYEAATVDSYEIGTKNVLANGALTLNAALFLNEISDDHLLVFDPATFTTRPENLDTRSMGAEVDAAWMVGGGITLAGGAAYTEASIDSTSAAAGVTAGDDVPNTPRWSALFSVQHQTDLPPFLGLADPLLTSRASYRYTGDRPADPQNTFDLAEHHKVDMRVGVMAGATEVYLWGDNLLDERLELYGYYYPAMIPGGSDARFGAAGEGRSFGIGLHHTF